MTARLSVAVTTLHVVPIEAVAVLEEDVVLAGLLEDGLARHVQRVLDLAAVDHDAQRRAGAHRGIGLVEIQHDVELADGAGLEERAARRAGAERPDLRGERAARQRVDLHRRRLAGLEVVAIDSR